MSTKRIYLIVSILSFILFASCARTTIPNAALQSGVPSFKDKNRRLVRFVQAFLPRVLTWTAQGSSNPLGLMCASGYVPHEGCTVSQCVQIGSVTTSATLNCSGIQHTHTNLWEMACLGDYHQGFQAAQATTIQIQVDQTSLQATVVLNLGGTLYGLTSDWQYFNDEVGLMAVDVGNTLVFRRNNTTGELAFTCVDGSTSIVIDKMDIDCPLFSKYFSEACVYAH